MIAAKVDYNDEASLVSALKGQQILVITLSVRAPPDTQAKLVEAASKAGVPYVMPNAWGTDPTNVQLTEKMGFGKRFGKSSALKTHQSCVTGGRPMLSTDMSSTAAFTAQTKSLSNISWTAMACGCWYEFSLGGGPDRYGFDIAARSVTFFDDGATKINTSTFAQCGRALAAFLCLPLLPEDEDDTRAAVAKWSDDVLRVSSFLVSQRDMFESVKRVTGTTDADWRISYEDSVGRCRRGMDAFAKGDVRGFVRGMYAAVFVPGAGGDYGSPNGLHNGVLGLSEVESLDEATKEAVRRGLEGIL